MNQSSNSLMLVVVVTFDGCGGGDGGCGGDGGGGGDMCKRDL